MSDLDLEVQYFTDGNEVAVSSADVGIALDDLDAALDALRVQPLSDDVLSRVTRAEATYEMYCSEGATCNFKCGATAYWECGPSAPETCTWTCSYVDTCGTSPCVC